MTEQTKPQCSGLTGLLLRFGEGFGSNIVGFYQLLTIITKCPFCLAALYPCLKELGLWSLQTGILEKLLPLLFRHSLSTWERRHCYPELLLCPHAFQNFLLLVCRHTGTQCALHSMGWGCGAFSYLIRIHVALGDGGWTKSTVTKEALWGGVLHGHQAAGDTSSPEV